MVTISIRTTTHGPLFNGMARPIMDHGCNEAERDIADETERMIRARLGRVLRHPTGRYMSHIHTVRRGGVSEVNDRGIIYGHWLEGTGSRNFPKTRFKGYYTFRIVAAQIQQRAAELADPAIDRAARRL